MLLTAYNHIPFYSPRVWSSMHPFELWRLCKENSFAIEIHRWPMFVCAMLTTWQPTVMVPLQSRLYGKKSKEADWAGDPIFVIGHWRSGTTLLHNLLTLDEQYAAPNTFQCFTPKSFLVTEPWLRPMTSWLVPKQRPMDNVEMGWGVAQEDEFALLAMGVPTTYRRIAFPNAVPRDLEFLNMRDIRPDDLKRWKEAFSTFLKYLNFKYRKPLVLKSPPHTGRIRVLKEMYPNARFVHITRDPRKLVPSTMHMWRSLDNTNGFQRPSYDDLRDYVFACYRRMYDGFFRDRPLLGDGEFVEIRFEQLVRDPVDTLETVYKQLQLGDYGRVREKIRQSMGASKNYKKNEYQMEPDLLEQIETTFDRYIEEFGYASVSTAQSQKAC